MISGPVAILPCPDCRATGRVRVQGVQTNVRCEKCGGEGYLSARYYRKLIMAQRLARQALVSYGR